jgi:hypothetical protein
MYEQINAQFAGMTKQFTDAAAKANAIAIENAERVFGLQMKTFEANLSATADFFNEAAELRQPADFNALLPKGLQVAKENAERAYQSNQEVFGEVIKTQQALGQIATAQFEAAGEQVKQTAAKAGKAAK